MENIMTELQNSSIAEGIGDKLVQFSVYLTADQAQWVQKQVKERNNSNHKTSFSIIIRECIDNGFQQTQEDTNTLVSMRKGSGK